MPHGFRNNPRKQQQRNRSVATSELDEQHPMLRAFRGYARELDEKHDRNERIVKLSRDITIEAKRIIFLLHTIDGRKNNRAQVLEEAQQRLNKVIDVNFKAVAKELLGQDPYQYRWAYSPGLQEFIEAYSFYEYFKSGEDVKEMTEENGIMESNSLSDWVELQQKMQYTEQIVETASKQQEGQTDENGKTEEKAPPKEDTLHFKFFVDPTEYILGVSDLTGELMRRCINSLGSGETEACLDTCKALQQFYTGYISLHVQRCRELSRKIFTMRQSLLKAENVCYNVKVRGGEAAKWGAVFDSKPTDDIDEGFF